MRISIEIAKKFRRWSEHKNFNKSFFKSAVREVLVKFPNFINIKNVELSILLTDNTQMQELNSKFRHKNEPTNVLSFPDIVIDSKRILEFEPDLEYMYLGDIAFGYQIIEQESLEQKILFKNHFTHLLIHSILHLLGYDHITEEDAERMQNVELAILEKFAINLVYN